MLRNLHFQPKDLSAASGKHRCQLTKARVITFEEVVQLREGREHEDAQQSPRAETRKMKHTRMASKKIECLRDTRYQEKLHTLVKCVVTNIQKAAREDDEDLVDEA